MSALPRGRRSALAVAMACAALWPAPAAAQPAQAVRGGGSFNDAPVLAPGLYRDDIRTGETLFYAVELAYGQKLRTTVTFLRNRQAEAAGFFGENVFLDFFAPSRDETAYLADAGDIYYPESQLVLRATTPQIGDDRGYQDPGAYFVTVAMEKDEGEARQPFQFDILLSVEVLGQPLEQPSPSPLATAEPEASPPEAAAPPVGDGDDGPSVVRIYLLSFVVGVVGGGAGRAWLRARRAG